MSKRGCSVFGCNNSYKNNVGVVPPFHLYSFPSRPWEKERRNIWIRFVKRKNKDGTDWVPNRGSGICCRHFVNNKKSDHPKSASYNPTVYILKEAITTTNVSKKKRGNTRVKSRKNEESDEESDELELKCFVKGCSSNSTITEQKLTYFYPPKDPVMFEQWKRLFPENDGIFCQTSRICELHFKEEFFIRDFNSMSRKGIILSREGLKLSADALPTIFPNASECLTRLLKRKPQGDETLLQQRLQKRMTLKL